MTEFIENIKNKVEINSEKLKLFIIYSFILIILMRFSLYPSLYSYDSNAHILVADFIIDKSHFPDINTWIRLGPDDAILPLFNHFFGIISILTNISTYYIGKYFFPALTFTIIFIFAYLILKSLDTAKLSFSFLILCLFFMFISPKVLQNLACSVRPEILGILLLLAFKYPYIRFIKSEQPKDLIIPLMIGITIILIHYLAGLFFVSSFLIYGIFFGDKRVCRYKIINEFMVAFALFAFFWGIAIFGGSDIYGHLYYTFKGSVNKPVLFSIPLIGIFVIKKSVPFGIDKFKGVLPRFKNLLERYQIILVLSLLVVLFAGIKMISTTSDFKLFLANNIHWIVFIPLSFFYLLSHIINENKDRSISFLSCFLIFPYFFSFVFLFVVYSGISGFYSTAWVIRFIGYAFFEMTVFGMFFARDIFGQSTLKNLKIHSKVALLLILLITTIFVTAYYVDKPSDKFPPMVASNPMLSAEKYVIEGVQLKYVAGLPRFIYDGSDFRRKLDRASFEKLHYGKKVPDLIHDLSKGKNPDKDYTLYLNIKRIKKYGGIPVGTDISKITRYELHKIENNPALSKIYSNSEVNIYDSHRRSD